MTMTTQYWHTIVQAFDDGPKQGGLDITKTQEKSYTFSVQPYPRSTLSFKIFGELIGTNRLNAICERMHIYRDYNVPFLFTRENVHKIFLGMMDIKKEDIDALSLVLPFQSVETLYKKCLLFENFQEFKNAFLENAPDIEQFKVDKCQTSGKGLSGQAERIALLAYHHFTLLTEPPSQAQICRDAEMLTSRLADREMEKGTVIHLHDGYFYVDEVFVKGGAYVAALRDFNNEMPLKIVCRGTAMRNSATGGWLSGINDLLLEMGLLGIKGIWPTLSTYLKTHSVQHVEILGKSLGGAIAQELAVLIEGTLNIHVEKLITCCSVGVGREIHQLFETEVLAKRNLGTPFNIEVLRNGGDDLEDEADYIPTVGGEHLGANGRCHVQVTYLGTGQNVVECPLSLGTFHRVQRFVRSFAVAHCRQTTLKSFHWKTLSDPADIEKHLKLGNQLETIRRVFAWLINLLTLFLLNGKNFKNYYHSQRLA